MKLTSVGDKRPRYPSDDSDQPAPKKRRTAVGIDLDAVTLLLDMTEGMHAQISAECWHALDVLNRSLEEDPHSLDLSAWSESTLTAITPLIDKAALAKVKSLTLPPNLDSLPELCDHMTALEQITLQNFLGQQLDLLKWTHLRKASGSLSANTADISVSSQVDLWLTSERTSKVRCHLVFDNGQVKRQALPGHRYYKVLPGRAGPELGSLNFAACFQGSNKPIVCRHIASYVQPRLESKNTRQLQDNGYLGISSAGDLQQKILPSIDVDFHDNVDFSCAYHCVTDDAFGDWVNAQMTGMLHDAGAVHSASGGTLSRSYLALSSNHAMVLVLRCKPHSNEAFVELFHDPNQTLTHRRQADSQLSRICIGDTRWRFSSLIAPAFLKTYFVDGAELALVFVDSRRRAKDQPARFHLEFANGGYENLVPTMLSFGWAESIDRLRIKLKTDYENATANVDAVFKLLRAPVWQQTLFGLDMAISKDHSDTVTAWLKVIEDFMLWIKAPSTGNMNSSLPPDWERKILRPCISWPRLYRHVDGNHRAFRALLDGVTRLNEEKLLSDETCVSLIEETHEGRNLMQAALLAHDAKTIAYIGRLLAQLLRNDAMGLVRCGRILDDSFGNPATEAEPLAWTVLRHCPQSTMDAYAELLKSLRIAVSLNASNMMAELTVYPTQEIDRTIDERLVMPLLLPERDWISQPASSELSGAGQLVDRLKQLTGRSHLHEGAPWHVSPEQLASVPTVVNGRPGVDIGALNPDDFLVEDPTE